MEPDDAWRRYGRALIGSMSGVLDETDTDTHALLLETADYWLSLGLAIGLERTDQAETLLELIESKEDDRTELARDAETFCGEALG
jgi:hypothetical protein